MIIMLDSPIMTIKLPNNDQISSAGHPSVMTGRNRNHVHGWTGRLEAYRYQPATCIYVGYTYYCTRTRVYVLPNVLVLVSDL